MRAHRRHSSPPSGTPNSTSASSGFESGEFRIGSRAPATDSTSATYLGGGRLLDEFDFAEDGDTELEIELVRPCRTGGGPSARTPTHHTASVSPLVRPASSSRRSATSDSQWDTNRWAMTAVVLVGAVLLSGMLLGFALN